MGNLCCQCCKRTEKDEYEFSSSAEDENEFPPHFSSAYRKSNLNFIELLVDDHEKVDFYSDEVHALQCTGILNNDCLPDIPNIID